MESLNTNTVDVPVIAYAPANIVEEKEVSYYRNSKLNVKVETTFSVYNGSRLVNVGDLIKHWDGELLGENEELNPPLPANTFAIKITKIKAIEPLTTGVSIEGVLVTVEGELILK